MVKWWVLGIIAVVAGFYFVSARRSRKKCIYAFGQGVADAGKLSWTGIRKSFESYLEPMRAEEAAAYRRGVEYSLSAGPDAGLESMKRSFLDAYASGTIAKEGSAIKKLGAEAAAADFILRVPGELMLMIQESPEQPPLVSKNRISWSG